LRIEIGWSLSSRETDQSQPPITHNLKSYEASCGDLLDGAGELAGAGNWPVIQRHDYIALL
jgi:hypothetical protein